MKSKFSRRGFLRGALFSGAAAAITGRTAEAAEEERERRAEPEAGASAPTSMDSVEVRCQVNGREHTHTVHPDDDALSLVRDRLGLTGAKRACGHGACGACTALLDGVPHVTCLLPAAALEGRALTTVEGLCEEELHPVQRAFMAEDALQCGYCTPGFVVEASAFHDRWRKERGTVEPTQDEIADALSGHLCRCGAYQSIYKAVAGACTGRFDADGAPPVRVDALAKVTGAAKYTVDIHHEGQLEGKILRSPVGHAVLKGLDLDAARAVPGVKAVIRMVEDGATLRYAGQEIAAVAATDERAAREAIKKLAPQLEILPALHDLEQALDPASAPVYEELRGQKFPNATEGPLIPAKWAGPNLRGPLSSAMFSKPKDARERVAEARGAGRAASGTYRTQVQCHTALEPHSTVARWLSEDALEVYASTQSCVDLTHEISERWGLKKDSVRVLCEYVGGGFGAKALLQIETAIAIDLAREAKAPVRVALDRAEELAVGGNRPGSKLELSVAWDEAGELYGVESAAYNEAGTALGTNTGMLVRLLYPTEYKALDDYDVVTHGAPGKPLRGPGGPPSHFALEQTVDIAAALRGEDPIELRRRWDKNPVRLKLYDWAEALPEWKGRPAPQSDKGRYRRGFGVASGVWFVFLTPNTQIQLEATADGFVASTAAQDMGNGARSVVYHTIQRALNLEPGELKVRFGDSRDVVGPLAGGSRMTASVAPAAEEVARLMQQELLEMAASDLRLNPVELAVGGVKSGERFYSWRDILSFTGARVSVVGRRPRDPGGYFFPFTLFDIKVGKEATASLQLAHLEVDTRLGRIRVLETWTGIGCGKMVVPQMARSQVEGAVIQGVSYALYEERRLDPKSAGLLTAGLEDYRIAGIGDIPNMNVHFEESGFEGMLGRSAGISELATIPVAASIANAVNDALGWRPTRLPIRVDRVLGGVS